ncbi:MAG TPA: cation:proton antiporter [Kofleriaceae bacterium]|jgi:Kef-type K+ transport system membrane component KefB
MSLVEIGRRITDGANAANLAFVTLLASLIVAPMLAAFVRLPAIVALVLAGMLIGPHGLGILATKQIALSALGDFGLLYLMFSAGLELDLKRLVQNKRVAIAFALLSFVIPFSLGLASARMLGYASAAAVLMGSNWGSHTLVTYPMLRELGLARNRAVSAVVGATAVTDTSALLVLAGVSVATRRAGSFLAEGAEVMIGLSTLTLWSIFGLPRVARWFFARVGSNSAERFLFALGAFFLGAILAEAAGIDGIVGAFFAGLGLGRAIPAQSTLMDRVQFVGGALFVPIFMISVGVLLDPNVLLQPTTVLHAAVFTVTVLGGKSLAAIVVGRRAGFTRPEIGVMSGLSGSQAAATLATTLVGARLGLFDARTVNAVLVVILVTLIITPAMVGMFGRKLSAATAPHDVEPLGRTILVPVWGTSTRSVLALAGRLAEDDTGMVLAGSFVSDHAGEAELARQRKLRTEAEDWLAKEGLEARSVLRVSRSSAVGLVETARAEGATMVVSEWEPTKQGLEADEETADVLTNPPVPIVLARGKTEPFARLIVVVRSQKLIPPGRRDLELARDVCIRIARNRSVSVIATSWEPISALFAQMPHMKRIWSDDPLGWVEANAGLSDLVVLPGLDEVHAALERIPDMMDRRFLVAIAARAIG